MVEITEHPLVERVLRTGSPVWGSVQRFPDGDEAYRERRELALFPLLSAGNGGDPCAGCIREGRCGEGCEDWRGYYLHRQRRINAYARRQYRKGGKAEKFAYSHPDAVRRYLAAHPCGDCPLEPGCDIPCGRYLHWYDARMAMARVRGGM